jgi:hypothetical protein
LNGLGFGLCEGFRIDGCGVESNLQATGTRLAIRAVLTTLKPSPLAVAAPKLLELFCPSVGELAPWSAEPKAALTMKLFGRRIIRAQERILIPSFQTSQTGGRL